MSLCNTIIIHYFLISFLINHFPKLSFKILYQYIFSGFARHCYATAGALDKIPDIRAMNFDLFLGDSFDPCTAVISLYLKNVHTMISSSIGFLMHPDLIYPNIPSFVCLGVCENEVLVYINTINNYIIKYLTG